MIRRITNLFRKDEVIIAENKELRGEVAELRRKHANLMRSSNKALREEKKDRDREIAIMDETRAELLKIEKARFEYELQRIEKNHAERVNALEIALQAATDALDKISATNSLQAVAARSQLEPRNDIGIAETG